MIIICRKCRYEMSSVEILAYLSSHAYDIVKEATPCILQYFLKVYGVKSYTDHAMKYLLRFTNTQKMDCPECFAYEGWILIDEQLKSEIDREVNDIE